MTKPCRLSFIKNPAGQSLQEIGRRILAEMILQDSVLQDKILQDHVLLDKILDLFWNLNFICVLRPCYNKFNWNACFVLIDIYFGYFLFYCARLLVTFGKEFINLLLAVTFQ